MLTLTSKERNHKQPGELLSRGISSKLPVPSALQLLQGSGEEAKRPAQHSFCLSLSLSSLAPARCQGEWIQRDHYSTNKDPSKEGSTHEGQFDMIAYYKIPVHEFYVQNIYHTWQIYTTRLLLRAGKGQRNNFLHTNVF